MKIVQTGRFSRIVKRLSKSEKIELDNAVRLILNNTKAGKLKVGDLSDIRVIKYKFNNQIKLLAYIIRKEQIVLMAYGSHENFYRDLKNE